MFIVKYVFISLMKWTIIILLFTREIKDIFNKTFEYPLYILRFFLAGLNCSVDMTKSRQKPKLHTNVEKKLLRLNDSYLISSISKRNEFGFK